MPKTGLYLCECGSNIAEIVDLDKITELISNDQTVVFIERHKLLCSKAGKEFLAKSINDNGCERVVIAACSPKQHETTFMEVMSEAGLNPYLMQLVNIREQCAWVTPDKEAATKKALYAIRAAINRVKYHSALEKKEIDCFPEVIVIGGSVAGLEVALQTARQNRRVYLLEENKLGVSHKDLCILMPTSQSAEKILETKIDAVRNNEYIQIFENCKIEEILGFFGNFIARIRTQENIHQEFNAGAVVLTLDAQAFSPERLDNFGYGKLDNVHTAAEFETLQSDTVVTKTGNPPNSVAIIHCVGRKTLGYCSKTCCVNSMKIARHIKDRLPGCRVIQLYRNLCLPDIHYDKFYNETKDKSIEFVRYKEVNITQKNKNLEINVMLSDNVKSSVPVDMVILSTGLVPAEKAKYFAHIFNIPLDEYGFLKEEHSILEPLSTVTEGVFITSGMYGPGDMRDSLTQAGAVAGKILSNLVPGKRVELETKTSEISGTMCMGCGVCVDVCAYGAVKLDESRKISIVNEVLCRGCGNCAAACPSGAARHKHFTTKQISQEMIQIIK